MSDRNALIWGCLASFSIAKRELLGLSGGPGVEKRCLSGSSQSAANVDNKFFHGCCWAHRPLLMKRAPLLLLPLWHLDRSTSKASHLGLLCHSRSWSWISKGSRSRNMGMGIIKGLLTSSSKMFYAAWLHLIRPRRMIKNAVYTCGSTLTMTIVVLVDALANVSSTFWNRGKFLSSLNSGATPGCKSERPHLWRAIP